MPCFCCKSDQHVAVASRADSSAAAPQAGRMSDRGFDDDKAAVQKWRDQHSPVNHDSAGSNRDSIPVNAGKNGEEESSDSSGSSSVSTYNIGIDETKKQVRLSPRAVQAWQQKQQDRPYNATSRSTKEALRSPYEISSDDSSSKQSHQQQSQQQIQPRRKKENTKPPRTSSSQRSKISGIASDLESDVVISGRTITPDASPSLGVSPVQSPILPNKPPPDQARAHPHSKQFAKVTTPKQKSKLSLAPKQQRHDHEGLRDQLIRDVILQQEASPSSGSNSSNNRSDGERIQGEVFLQVNPRNAISPRSSVGNEETETYTSSYFWDDTTASVSDIFSDNDGGLISSTELADSLGGDSETRERHILACRLLRTRMLQPHPPPILPMERDLLLDLLFRFKSSQAAGSQVAYETLSKILAQDEEQHHNNERSSNSHYQDDCDDGPIAHSRFNTTASSRQSSGHSLLDAMSRDGDFTVASIREEETGFNTVLKQSPNTPATPTADGLPPNYPRAQSWKDEKNPKAMPKLLEEEQQDTYNAVPSHAAGNQYQYPKLPVKEPSSSMIRLDGWNSATREQYPFHIMGLDRDTPPSTRVLTPALMEALRGFFPYAVSEDNFWLKFSLVRDGASIKCLLRNVMASQHTIISVETVDGDVFGSFTSTAWRNHDHKKWFGTGEAFLWRVKQSRYVEQGSLDDSAEGDLDQNHEMEIFPYTGHDDMVQYCTSSTLAVGGGSWTSTGGACPFPGEPTGIGLLVDGDLEGGETNSCATFNNPRLYGRSSSSNEFTIRNLEVWTLTPCDNITLAEQLERQKYFVNEHMLTADKLSSSPIQKRLPPL